MSQIVTPAAAAATPPLQKLPGRTGEVAVAQCACRAIISEQDSEINILRDQELRWLHCMQRAYRQLFSGTLQDQYPQGPKAAMAALHALHPQSCPWRVL